MREIFFSVFYGFIVLGCVLGDSYIEAYKQSQNEKLDAVIVKGEKNIDREFIDSNDIPYQYGPPEPQYNYGQSVSQYGPQSYPQSPNPGYGSPSPPQGPPYGSPSHQPQPAYGPPAPPPPPPPPPAAYGPPAPPYGPPIYGPPPSSIQVFYGMPHALSSFWEKLKFKLDLFTIGKILLKLVLFKKFVSFVAVICLLLFIPALKSKLGYGGNGGGGEGRFDAIGKLGNKEITQLYNSIYKAINNFTYEKDEENDKYTRYQRR